MRKLLPYVAAALLFSALLIACTKNKGEDLDTEQDVPETLPPVQKAINFNITGNIGGFHEALPARYDSTTKNYPLLVFCHGSGEMGNGTTDLARVANNAVPALIKNKKFPPSFTVDGKAWSFIVLSPQFKAWPSPDDIKAVINYAISKYRVDTTRLYVSGLSMGGGVTWEYAAVYGNKVAAIVPICGASGPTDQKAQKIVQFKLPVWAFHNQGDPTVTVNNSTGYISRINALNPTPPAKLTIWQSNSHDAWTKACNPETKENNMNMYEWMLQYHR